MKSIIINLCVSLIFISSIFTQPMTDFKCGVTTANILPPPVNFKPHKTPNTTSLKILIVYITFADDNEPGNQGFWPIHEKPKTPLTNLPLLYPEKINNTNIHPADKYPEFTY